MTHFQDAPYNGYVVQAGKSPAAMQALAGKPGISPSQRGYCTLPWYSHDELSHRAKFAEAHMFGGALRQQLSGIGG
jgi:hypothetical protein